jgi:DNA (cytosine-5)-methyltransferase 1
LHGYDDEHIVLGPIRARSGVVRELDQHRLIANSVPPPLAFVLGKKIMEALES